MFTDVFSEFEAIQKADGSAAVLEKLAATFRDQKQYHQLFDVLLMQKKLSLGAPLIRPTSFDDVPVAAREEFEEAYVAAARQVGLLLLEDRQLGQAWMYLRTIRETDVMRQAIEKLNPKTDNSEEVIDIALYQGVAPVKGLQMMLQSHGTCSSITALDQLFMKLEPTARVACAGLLVNRIYSDLTETCQHEVERKQGLAVPGQTLRELISGRDWLFADANYHIDVSHLHSVVRFSRSLTTSAPELTQAIQLTEYGTKLAQQYQYAGDPPFEDYYTAHMHFLKALANINRDASLAYFRDKLKPDYTDADTQLTAFAFVDLLTRVDRMDEALEVATKYLSNVQEQLGFSLADLCAEAKRYDLLKEVAREKGDLLTFTAALLQNEQSAKSVV
jgi:hypothetical protein